MVAMATQVNYAMKCVQKVVEKKARSISVAEEANAKYVSERFLAHTVIKHYHVLASGA
jgi:hypothetical protein